METNTEISSATEKSKMDEIDILPGNNSVNVGQAIHTPTGVKYSMSIRDYQDLSRSNLKINKKKTNRIIGNRKRSPSEIDQDKKRRRALEEIFEEISKQEKEESRDLEDHDMKKICRYKGREIPYRRRKGNSSWNTSNKERKSFKDNT